MSKGLVIVITGHGKGKTTSALGQALRATGQGLKVLMIQFLKSSHIYGEIKSAKKLYPDFEIIQAGKECVHTTNKYDCPHCEFECHVDIKNPSKDDKEAAQRAFMLAREKILSGKYNLIILDEIIYAIDYGLLNVENVLNMINARPEGLHIILTGRNAPIQLTREADLVSEILEIKHQFHQGMKSVRGIDF
ncbi:MAG: cob(I)yrinic acid a,c-diamide adenosyltransferase [Planctomycetota bacterium]